MSTRYGVIGNYRVNEIDRKTYLVKTSNSKLDMKSLHVRSMVVLSAIVSSPEDIGCTLFSSSRKIFQGTRVLKRKINIVEFSKENVENVSSISFLAHKLIFSLIGE